MEESNVAREGFVNFIWFYRTPRPLGVVEDFFIYRDILENTKFGFFLPDPIPGNFLDREIAYIFSEFL